MAATTVTISNVEATPQVMLNRHEAGQGLKVAARTVEVAALELSEADDRTMLIPVPSGGRFIDLIIYNDDLDSNGSPTLTMDVGLFYGPDNKDNDPGVAIDDDCFATAVTTFQAANTAGVHLGFEALDINKIGKPFWEIAGLTANPGGMLYIGLSVAAGAGTAAAGTVTAYALYV